MDLAQLRPPEASFFDRGAVEVAQDLLGCYLIRELRGMPKDEDDAGPVLGGRIVETEAYTANDPASHSYPGPTARNRSMFRQGGTLYVYLIYGVHYCLNVVTGPSDRGEAVLLRAIEPVWGVRNMARRRGMEPGRLKGISDGPGKMAQAFGVSAEEDGTSLMEGPLRLLMSPEPMDPKRIASTERIGISKGMEKRWRFVDSESALLSRPLRR